MTRKTPKERKTRLAEQLLDAKINELTGQLHPLCPICGEPLDWSLQHEDREIKCKFSTYLKLYDKVEGK